MEGTAAPPAEAFGRRRVGSGNRLKMEGTAPSVPKTGICKEGFPKSPKNHQKMAINRQKWPKTPKKRSKTPKNALKQRKRSYSTKIVPYSCSLQKAHQNTPKINHR
ncbi:MAG TPA: hypothetical protein PK722_10265, partial [Kiritimatiellia bacterium]|nr:hypothetical protein [Kiritimatiellia bacterium]